MEVVEVLAFTATGALVVRPSFPEYEHIIGVAVRHAVLADVVNLPANARRFEKVEDDRVIEHAIAPHAISCDPARGAGGEIEAIGPCGAHYRTEVVRAQRRGFEEAVVEGKIVGSVVT